MGRYIYCGDDFVWKYAFGEQSSEMYLIHEELGIGEYVFTEDGDTLTLYQKDVELLDRALAKITNDNEESYFNQMVKAIRDYIRAHPDREQFVFDGEF